MNCTLCKDTGELHLIGDMGEKTVKCYACKGTYAKSKQERELREGEYHYPAGERKPKSVTDILAHAVATGSKS